MHSSIGFDHFVGDDAGQNRKLLAAMYHTMTNCIDLFQVRDCSGLLVGQTRARTIWMASLWVGMGASVNLFVHQPAFW